MRVKTSLKVLLLMVLLILLAAACVVAFVTAKLDLIQYADEVTLARAFEGRWEI